MPDIIKLAQSEERIEKQAKKTLLLIVDMQNDFLQDIGSLAVPNSRKDVENLTKWIYNNIDKISQIMCSEDMHSIKQIFHPYWWVDKEGNNPEPFTVIKLSDVQTGVWSPVYEKEKSIEYLKGLEGKGKNNLCIWPYHCIEGSIGANIEWELTKMIYFHSTVNDVKPIFVYKGTNPVTEMYGVIKGEYDPEGYKNMEVLELIKQYDQIYVAGEASSHCVLETVRQILEHYEEDLSIGKKITVLRDCMSPVAGFEEIEKVEFKLLEDKYGISIKNSSECKID